MKLGNEQVKTLWRRTTTRDHDAHDCLSEELLLRAGLNQLAEAERLPVAHHLTTCSDCVQEYRLARAARAWAIDAVNEHHHQSAERAKKKLGRVIRLDRPHTNWLHLWADKFFTRLGFNAVAAALTVIMLIVAGAFAVWTAVFFLETRVLKAQLEGKQEELGKAAELQTQIEEMRGQVDEVRGRLEQQNTDQIVATNNAIAAENARLVQEYNALLRPQLDVPVAEIAPAGLADVAEPGRETEAKIVVPASAPFFTVVMRLNGEQNHPALLVELIDRKFNKVIWSGQRKQSTTASITLTLAKRSYPAGRYRVRISGVNGKRRTPLEQYDFQAEYAAESAKPAKPAKK